jgi:hypothetical protein
MLSWRDRVLIAVGSLVAAVAILSAVEAMMRYYRVDICMTPCLVGDMIWEDQDAP